MKNASLLIISVWVVVFFLATLLRFNLGVRDFGEQQYVLLAESFLLGRWDIDNLPSHSSDLVLHGGKYYWPLGPAPAVLLTVPVWVFWKLHMGWFGQGYMQILMNIGVWYGCYYLARKNKIPSSDAAVLGFAFVFASVYQFVGMVPFPWYLVQTLTVFLTLLAIGEWKSGKRYWVIGILMGLVFMSRFTAGLGAAFFAMAILTEKHTWRKKLSELTQLAIPILLSGIILLGYNQVRFGSMWDNGYEAANKDSMTMPQRYELENYGLFKLANVPTNIYYYFLKGLDPVRKDVDTLWGKTYVLGPPYVQTSYPGTSFFVVSPIFLYMAWASFRKKEVRMAAVTSLMILALLLTYYWPGWRQVGPRYMLDLLPFWYMILLTSFEGKRVTPGIKVLIVVSALINLMLGFGVLYRR